MLTKKSGDSGDRTSFLCGFPSKSRACSDSSIERELKIFWDPHDPYFFVFLKFIRIFTSFEPKTQKIISRASRTLERKLFAFFLELFFSNFFGKKSRKSQANSFSRFLRENQKIQKLEILWRIFFSF